MCLHEWLRPTPSNVTVALWCNSRHPRLLGDKVVAGGSSGSPAHTKLQNQVADIRLQGLVQTHDCRFDRRWTRVVRLRGRLFGIEHPVRSRVPKSVGMHSPGSWTIRGLRTEAASRRGRRKRDGSQF